MADRKYPRHDFWGPNEPGCPPELKAPNGELCDMRCKVCGDGWRESHDVCMAALKTVPDAERLCRALRQFVKLVPAGDECRLQLTVGVQSFFIGIQPMPEDEAAHFAGLFVLAMAGIVQHVTDGVTGMNSWRSIDTAPKDGSLILLRTDKGVVVVGKRNKHLQIWVEADGRETPRTVGYWMPIPAAVGVTPCDAPSMVEQIRGSTEYVSWFPIKAQARPCDLPGGCNARNCLSCGETSHGVAPIQGGNDGR